uniref:Molybdopterin dinucleotide-binding domain-containing protein n=1 Tax=Archaeoglobus fulgidus TaxID=2234 RepID=A0A7J2TLE3_ARCFL
MFRLTKLLKFEAFIVVARHSEQEKAVIYLNPEFAKKTGIKEGDVVSVTKDERKVNFRVKILDTAPENGGLIPNSIFASYLTDFENFKSFKAYLEIAEGEESKAEDIIKIIMDRK